MDRSFAASLGLQETNRPHTLDPNAHVGRWSELIGTVAVPLFLVACVLHRLLCYTPGRAVSDYDAPELEELNDAAGNRTTLNDTVSVKAGRLVSAVGSAQPLAPADEEAGERGSARPGFPKARRGDGADSTRTKTRRNRR